MPIDIRTLTLLLGLALALQTVSLTIQYLLNRSRPGLGWWLCATGLGALGFAVNILRDHPVLGPVCILAGNAFFVGGHCAALIGTRRFFGRPAGFKPILAVWTLLVLVAAAFIWIDDCLTCRWVNASLGVALLALAVARDFLRFRTAEHRAAAIFLAATFGLHGAFFAARGLQPLFGPGIGDFFTPSGMQIATYLVTLVSTTLWTYGFIIMVNQRLLAENRDAVRNMELIFNTSPDAVSITRLGDGVFVRVNDGFTAMTGADREDVIGRNTQELSVFDDPSARERIIALLRTTGRCDNEEAVFVRHDGTRVMGMVSAKVIDLDGEPHVLSVVRDITERKRAENLRVEIERIMQHDLRSPAASAVALARYFAESPAMSEAERSMARKLELSGQHILDTLSINLTLHRIEAGQYLSSQSGLDAAAILRDIADRLLLLPEHAGKGVDILSAGRPDRLAPCICMGDETLLRLALQNILLNALEASPPGGRVAAALECSGACRMTIRNQGAVPPAIRTRFFDKYVTMGKIKGTGIGTYSARVMIEAQGGGIAMRALDDEDTTEIVIDLPTPSDRKGSET
ncbi:PAS domain-containing sensor histidine kinase [Desulfomicrobium salsuginis]